eukprot:5423572-Alexandrium_andersonii.AAC.1
MTGSRVHGLRTLRTWLRTPAIGRGGNTRTSDWVRLGGRRCPAAIGGGRGTSSHRTMLIPASTLLGLSRP